MHMYDNGKTSHGGHRVMVEFSSDHRVTVHFWKSQIVTPVAAASMESMVLDYRTELPIQRQYVPVKNGRGRGVTK